MINLKDAFKSTTRNVTSSSSPSERSHTKLNWSKKKALAATLALSVVMTGVLPFQSANALTNLTSESGTVWEFHDSFAPNLDTGSLRRIVSTQAQGFGNIFVQVSSTPEPIMNGQMMRGFGLEFDNVNSFNTTQSVNLGEVLITRNIYFDSTHNKTRFFDSFTNTTGAAVTVDVSFGGSLGYGTGEYASQVKATSSEDLTITPEDSWVLIGNNREGDLPVGIVLGSSAPFEGALTGTGNQQKNPFTTPLATSGNDANFYGFIHSLTIEPGETKSLARYVLVGQTGEAGVASTVTALGELTTQPDVTNLSEAQICTISNWDLSAIAGVDVDACEAVTRLDIPAAPALPKLVTSSPYDVINKSIAEMQTDMEKGITTSEQITRAYLDRITAYDLGQLGFHSFLHVSESAIEQAKAADLARREGRTGELLGIPIAIKDIYDTKDMPTTGGSRALEGWQPKSDAYQVEKLREAGAVIIGKVNTSEFANSGSFSESGWMQTWNALYPSKTSFGSSGGSAVSVAANFAAAAMGSQTGVSLYAPSVGASLTTFRGTDGMASTRGVMPLTWGQDYAGPIARTVTDLAYLLNATTGTDPLDMLTVDADAKRPADWTEALQLDALQGKRIGYIPSSFVSSFADDGTGQAVMDKFSELEAAGATMVEMSAPPSAPQRPSGINGSTEGWARYIELHDDFPYENGDRLLASDKVLSYNQRNYTERPRMTESEVQAYIEYRTAYKEVIKQWMDEYDVDSVVYAGFISDVYNNDGATSQLSSDRATGVLTSNVGLPTVVVPVGVSPSGYSIAMQLVGRAWDDANILGMGYALEQQTKARLLTQFAPALTYVDGSAPTNPGGGNGGGTTPPPSGGNNGGGSTPPPSGGDNNGGPTTPPGDDATETPQDEQDPAEEISFTDTEGHWAKANIDLLISKGLLSGYPDGSFRPDHSLTRAESIKVIATYLGLEGQASSFTDVPASHWASSYIGAAFQSGLMQGYSDGSFRPNDMISRAELAALMTRAFKLEGTGAASFKDVSTSAWSYAYIDALAAHEIVTGYADGTFKPNQAITRAEFATIMTRLLQALQ